MSDISNLTAIIQAMPDKVLSPILATGEVKMTIAIMMITTGFVKPIKPLPTTAISTSTANMSSSIESTSSAVVSQLIKTAM